jgi:hypothetical protein
MEPQTTVKQPSPLADQAKQATKFANLPQLEELPSGRTVKILPLPWVGYKKIRSQLIAALTGEIGNSLRKAIEAWDRLVTGGTATTPVSVLVHSGLLQSVPELLVDIETRVEDLATDLITACCPDVDFDALPVHDMLTLRRYVLDSINLPELLDLEKNLFRGIVGSVMTTVGITTNTKTDETNQAGAPAAESVSSASSETPVPQTSNGTSTSPTPSGNDAGGADSNT